MKTFAFLLIAGALLPRVCPGGGGQLPSEPVCATAEQCVDMSLATDYASVGADCTYGPPGSITRLRWFATNKDKTRPALVTWASFRVDVDGDGQTRVYEASGTMPVPANSSVFVRCGMIAWYFSNQFVRREVMKVSACFPGDTGIDRCTTPPATPAVSEERITQCEMACENGDPSCTDITGEIPTGGLRDLWEAYDRLEGRSLPTLVELTSLVGLIAPAPCARNDHISLHQQPKGPDQRVGFFSTAGASCEGTYDVSGLRIRPFNGPGLIEWFRTTIPGTLEGAFSRDARGAQVVFDRNKAPLVTTTLKANMSAPATEEIGAILARRGFMTIVGDGRVCLQAVARGK